MNGSPPLEPISRSGGTKTSRKRRRGRSRANAHFALTLFLAVLALFSTGLMIFTFWFYLSPGGSSARFLLADSLITTQHREWAKYLIGQKQLDERIAAYQARFDEMSAAKSKPSIVVPPPAAPAAEDTEPEERSPYKIEPVEGAGFKGYILYVYDPKMLHIVVPSRAGKGEKVSSMVKRTGALVGVNAGGFVDPQWKGNGFQPTGLVLSGGEIFYNDGGDAAVPIVGIDRDGVLVTGKYRPSELVKMGVREAVTFSPRFIMDGKGLIPNEKEGWGIAPRTAIAQKKDGTILFAVIDGREPGHSIGATLYDVQQLFLARGAITAANLDGGSSTVLVEGDKIVNQPCSPYGERYLPTAFLVFDDPSKVQVRNIWEGLTSKDIDPSKW